ncbi:AT-hook motif nuclear-localized protein 23-like [Hibiscus syriacus]|uniref:AT-hook motif nuclear-localized protein 23-like n=1 Tax=Hibiscus syriacus TaxID=106335 RepID=UPI0019203F7C|nr:AT-hook motif nuclear-localized protein 23-like [Hibiscus syriacus]
MADYSATVSDFQAHATGDEGERNPPSVSDSGGGSAIAKTSTLDNIDKLMRTLRRGVETVAFEVSPGSDVIERIISFACRNHVGVDIISATGSVSNVTLWNASPLQQPVFLKGTFVLHTLIGSFFPEYCTPASSNRTPQSSSPCPNFRITFEGAQFQLFGGRVFGKLEAATQVEVVAAVLENPWFDDFPCKDDNEDPRQRKKARNANGETGSFASTCMYMDVYRGANPAPPNFQFPPCLMPWSRVLPGR